MYRNLTHLFFEFRTFDLQILTLTTMTKPAEASAMMRDASLLTNLRLSSDVMVTMASRVSKSTKDGYCNANAGFAVWIYHHQEPAVHRNLMAPSLSSN